MTRTVSAGTTQRIGYVAFLNPDYSFGGYAEVKRFDMHPDYRVLLSGDTSMPVPH